jgi:hypothetical protein
MSDDLAKLGIKVDAGDADVAAQLLDKLTKAADGTASSGELLMEGFKKMMVVLGPAALAGAMLATVRSATELQERYVRLSEVAGTTAANMAGLDLPARLAGTSLDSVAMAMARVSRSVGEAQLGDVHKKGLFAAMGIDPASGADAKDQLLAVAQSLMGMQDKNVQAYASLQLLGRGFAELRPFFKELIADSENHSRVTQESAEAAKHFEDQLTRLNYTLGQGKVALVNEYLPAINKVVDAMVRAQKEGGTFAAIIAGMQTVMTGDDEYKNQVKIVDMTERQLELMDRIDRLKNGATSKDPRLAGWTTVELHAAQRELTDVNAELATLLTYQRELDKQAGEKGAGGPTRDGMDDKAIAAIIAEGKLRKMMEDRKMYEARVAEQKGFAQRYADEIKLGDQLAEEAYKQGELGEVALLQKKGANRELYLNFLRTTVVEEERLAKGVGNLPKAQEAADMLKRIDQEVIANKQLTTAKVVTFEEGATLAFKREYAQRAAAQQISLQDNLTKLEAWKTEEDNVNEIAFNLGLRTYQDWESRMVEIAAKYEEDRTNIVDNEAKKRYKINEVYRKLDMDSAGAFFGYMKTLMQVKSKELFEIGKLGAIAESVVNTYAAATGAMKALSSIPIVGPALGFAAAAAITVAGLANVAAIQSTQYGGSSAASPTYSANPLTGTPTAPVGAQAGAAQSNAPSTLQVVIQGNILGTQQFVDQTLIPALADAINNRDFIIINGQSRQAGTITGV